VVEQQRRYPIGAEQFVRHDGEQHRDGEHRADDQPAGQVADLGAPLGFRLGGAGPTGAYGRSARGTLLGVCAVCWSDGSDGSDGSTMRVPWIMFIPQANPNDPALPGCSRTVVRPNAVARR
jgi:hypothetical protein